MTPNLLGLDYGPKSSREVKTQTTLRDFSKDDADFPELDVPLKKRRGRKPTLGSQGDEDQEKREEVPENTAPESEEANNPETEIIVNIIAPVETDAPGVRRSARNKKPTAKVLQLTSVRAGQALSEAKSPRSDQREANDVTGVVAGAPPPNVDQATLQTVDAAALKTEAEKQTDEVPQPQAVSIAGEVAEASTVLEVEPPASQQEETAGAKTEDVGKLQFVSLLQNPDAVAAVDELIETVEG